MQQSAVNFPNFMGTRAFVCVKGDKPSREKLPFLRPADEVIPIWTLVGKFIGQDLTKISLPVILSEPLSTCQKACESTNIEEELIAAAAQESDPLRRFALTLVHNCTQFNITKTRAKKPFNPMLGETYELVTEDFRWVAEQVSHHPPITAYYQEGKNYKIHGFIDSKSSLGFGGGKGLMEISQRGYQDYYYEKFDETVSVGRPKVYACNIVLGTLYVDFDGEVRATNHRTGDTAVLTFQRRGWASNSSMTGAIYDASGNEKGKLKGSWWDKISLTNSETGDEETLWREQALPADTKRMFGFGKLAVNLNHLSDELRSVLPPTDTRLRGDQRLYEEGKADEADEEKVRLEVKQRKARKLREEAGGVFTPSFFRQGSHPYVEGERRYEYITENCYWDRRERGDWEGQLDLW